MQIKIKCPNARCGKTLVVDSEMAGKKGKCSTCDAVFLIPQAANGSNPPGGSTAEVSSAPSKTKSGERKKPPSSGSQKSAKPRGKSGEKRSTEKFLDDYVEKPKSTPAKPDRPKPNRDELDDYSVDEEDYVDYDDYEADRPRPNRPSRGRSERPPGGRDDFHDDDDDDADAGYDNYDDHDDYDDYDDRRPRRRGRNRYEEDEYYEDPYEEDYYEDPYDRPRRSSRGGRKAKTPKIGLIRAGFLIMAIAGCVLAGAMGVKMLVFLLMMLSTSVGSGNTIAIIVKIRELLWLGASIAIIVGYSFLLFFPNKKGSLGLTIAALSLGGVNLLLRVFLMTVPLFSGTGFFGLGMLGLSMFGGGSRLEFFLKMGLIEGLYIAELVLVALAMAAINSHLKDRYNVQMSKRMIIPAGIYGGVLVVLAMFALDPDRIPAHQPDRRHHLEMGHVSRPRHGRRHADLVLRELHPRDVQHQKRNAG